MSDILWQLLRELAWPTLVVVVAGVMALVWYWNWVVKLSAEQRGDVKRKWWVFSLMLVAMLAGLGTAHWYQYRPLPKERGHVRLLLSAQADSPVASELSLALVTKLQRLLDSLRIERRVEVWLIPAIATDAKADDVVRGTNADAMLWIPTVPASSMEGVIYPRWRMRTSARPLFRSQLTARHLDARGPGSLNCAAEQIALEALDMLRPSLGDWMEKVSPQGGGFGPTPELPERPNAAMSVVLTVSRWSPNDGALGRATKVAVGEHMLLAVWACNHSDKTVNDLKLYLPLPPGEQYMPGFLTLNGNSLSEVGGVAVVDESARKVTFSIGDLGPGQRALATVGVTAWP